MRGIGYNPIGRIQEIADLFLIRGVGLEAEADRS